ncbi:hypothetical protein JI739_17050 [Ramlibacter sp. AW1]|uniref:DUF8082 domain-containing protein n=1 Tax=Ramlibacter aurantiacus TaxID=2801330 RepID=A0A937D681_9BURK|nr:hypothetical protein [Ramlibacter aurantiacus]MBL0422062.1 hypothetical protein [Ramlibacter aurantiacus]
MNPPLPSPALYPLRAMRPQRAAGLLEPAKLRTIEWPMQRTSTSRYSVAEFRPGWVPAPTPGKSAQPHAPAAGFTTRRSLVCTIVFIDLVGASMRPVDEQVEAKEAFKLLIGKALQDIPEESRLAIDTGDGAALCFIGPPTVPLEVARRLVLLLRAHRTPPMQTRIGLHLGDVRVVSDINNRANVLGDGINVAQRVMDFAQPDQLLASSTLRDAVCRIDPAAVHRFCYLGPFQDKHGRLHDIHLVLDEAPPVVAAQPAAASVPPPPAPRGVLRRRQAQPPITRDQLTQVADLLCREIGPLARVLVAREVDLGHSLESLVETLAVHIDSPTRRTQFRQAALRPSKAA